MILNCCFTCRDLRHQSLHHRHSFTSSKLPRHFPSSPEVFLGFNLRRLRVAKDRNTPSPFAVQGRSLRLSLCTQRPKVGPGISRGFEQPCRSKPLVAPAKNSLPRCKGKKVGGSLSSILRSLESGDSLDSALGLVFEKLSAKEQTVILKEQRSWDRVIRVFEFFNFQKEYVPNVIHYNIVLRALGRAQKWDELRLCWIEMARNSILPTNNTYGMLVDVFGKAGLLKESLLWVKHMRLCGMFPDEVTMNTVVRVLKDAGEYDRADRFYKGWCFGRIELDDHWLDSILKVGDYSTSAPISSKQFLLAELGRTDRRLPVSKSSDLLDAEGCTRRPRLTSTYNTLIDLYGKAGRLKDAAEVFSEMLTSGVAMDTITFNTMIFTCGTHGYLLEAESLLAKMEVGGILPDTKTYNIFLSLYADSGNIEMALGYYRNIRKVGLLPDAVSHRAILHILSKRNMVQEAEAVIKEMENFGVMIDEHSLPVLMKMYIGKRLLYKAKNLFEKTRGEIMSKTRAAIMDAYAENGFWVEAEAVFFSKSDVMGSKKGVMEYNVMIKAYGKAGLYDKAFALFKSMRNQGALPDKCTYNSLIQMFASGDMADRARDLLIEIQETGLKPHCSTFSSLIACYVRLGQLSDAVNVYEEMGRAGVKPNEVVYGSLINGYAEAGKVEEALQCLHIMEGCGLPANRIVLTSMIKAYGKDGNLEAAITLYDLIKKLKGGPDAITFNTILRIYADLGVIFEARVLFRYLREKGYADGTSYATMMYLYKNMGMLDEAVDVAEEMKQYGLLTDCASYNMVMACYAITSQLHKCAELLHEMISLELVPDNGTFRVLFTVLKKGGIPIEAVTQLESSYHDGEPFASEAITSSLFCLVGLHGFAMDLCDSFTKAGKALGLYAYNAALYAYGSSGEIDKALTIFMKMQDDRIEPDIVTYIHLVHCYGKAGMFEGVKRVYNLLKNGEIEHSKSLFKAVIDACRNSNRRDFAEVVNKEMEFALLEPEHLSQSEAEDRCSESFSNRENLNKEIEFAFEMEHLFPSLRLETDVMDISGDMGNLNDSLVLK